MWTLFPLIYQCFSDWAVDYMACMGNPSTFHLITDSFPQISLILSTTISRGELRNSFQKTLHTLTWFLRCIRGYFPFSLSFHRIDRSIFTFSQCLTVSTIDEIDCGTACKLIEVVLLCCRTHPRVDVLVPHILNLALDRLLNPPAPIERVALKVLLLEVVSFPFLLFSFSPFLLFSFSPFLLFSFSPFLLFSFFLKFKHSFPFI